MNEQLPLYGYILYIIYNIPITYSFIGIPKVRSCRIIKMWCLFCWCGAAILTIAGCISHDSILNTSLFSKHFWLRAARHTVVYAWVPGICTGYMRGYQVFVLDIALLFFTGLGC